MDRLSMEAPDAQHAAPPEGFIGGKIKMTGGIDGSWICAPVEGPGAIEQIDKGHNWPYPLYESHRALGR